MAGMEAIRNGDIPVDLVLLGMIAVFLVLRLRSVLGRRVGFERPEVPANQGQTGNRIPGLPVRLRRPDAAVAEARTYVLPDASSPTGQVLARMKEVDRSFDAVRFLNNAEQAFRVIVTAYAQGEREALRPLLTEATFTIFCQAIDAREQDGARQQTEIQSIRDIRIENARLEQTQAALTIRFVSDQHNVMLNRTGEPVEGVEGLTEIVDVWTFERDLASRDPTWRLSGTDNA
ncbi:Transporter [Granulibacter bethesdensis]|uniref:Transporter n=2 Tax=Granulibacter bethesdensis TaxID=364410 RepID=Q0BPM0_GRABC|nr:Transporter [Granulibacter bethesdensis CGDNIH1]AHJ67794.1 Transporter [Granulibacter bethesdensis]APH53110.1 Transporter [Granulibacter bethesdensis]APH65799.1 Transporter [Granulibacter bethesdensis]